MDKECHTKHRTAPHRHRSGKQPNVISPPPLPHAPAVHAAVAARLLPQVVGSAQAPALRGGVAAAAAQTTEQVVEAAVEGAVAIAHALSVLPKEARRAPVPVAADAAVIEARLKGNGSGMAEILAQRRGGGEGGGRERHRGGLQPVWRTTPHIRSPP